VEATVLAAVEPRPARILNIGGGEEATLAGVIAALEALARTTIAVERRSARRATSGARLPTPRWRVRQSAGSLSCPCAMV
jgi:hypothetical protein